MEGIPDLFQTLETVRTYFNPKLAIEGILLTMYDERTNLSKQVAEEIRKSLKHILFRSRHPPQRPPGRGPELRQAHRPLRHQVQGGRSLYQSRRGDHSPMSKKALGKGLGAFIPDEFSILKDERFAELDLEDVKPNPFQPRMKFDDQTIDELAQSIKETGIVQPVIVAPEDDHYKIIVGERRWRAAQRAGLRKIPVLIRNIPKDKQLEVSLIENIHREELNALEIAQAYQRLIDEHGYAQHELADKVGKDRSSVTNYLRLLKLPAEIQDRLNDGEI